MNSEPKRNPLALRCNDPAALLLALLCLFALMGAWNYAGSMPGIDYYVAWVAADATDSDTEHELYSREGQYRLGREYRSIALSEYPDTRRAEAARFVSYLHASATPFLYSVIGLLAGGDYDRDLSNWTALSLAGFVLAVLLIGEVLGLSVTTRLALLLACLAWMMPLHSDLRVGNVNGFQAGLVAIIFWLLSRRGDLRAVFAAGVLAAMLVLFKPNLAPIPIVLLGAWLLRGQFRRLLGGAAGMAVGTLVALAWSSIRFGGPGIWLDWWRSLQALVVQDIPSGRGNFNAGDVLGLQLSAGSQAGVALVLCAVALALLWWGRRARPAGNPERRERAEYGLLLGAACLIQVLVSPLVWPHYFLLAVPMLIAVLRPWPEPGAGAGALLLLRDRLLPLLALLLLLDGPLRDLLADEPVLAANRACVVSMIVLLAVGLLQLRFPPAARAETR